MNTKLILLAMCVGLAAGAQESDREERLRAEPPTVVNVEAKSDRVEAHQVRPERRAAKPWKRVFQYVGWSLDVDDDIPSSRERAERYRADDKTSSSAGR